MPTGRRSITKHPGSGGAVTVGTVTAQLLYEIAGPAYVNPDVVARFDSIQLEQLDDEGPDRVRITGVRGEPPPPTTKVCINHLGGFRNSATFVLTGLDLDAKAELVERALFTALGGREAFGSVDVTRTGTGSGADAGALLRVTVKDTDQTRVGRAFSAVAVELALASYPGFHLTSPPSDATPYGVYWPALVPAHEVDHRVVLPDGSVVGVGPPIVTPRTVDLPAVPVPAPPTGPTADVPLGYVFGARSGDKGGNANLGVWARSDEGWGWLAHELTVDRVRALLPEVRGLEVRRYELPNLRALNFVVVGLLGEGVASSTLSDPQAKALGERLRATVVDLPVTLVP